MIKALGRLVARKAVLLYSRLQDHYEIIDVCGQLSRIASALVLLPERVDHFLAAVEVLGWLRARFPRARFFILASDALLQSHAPQLAADAQLVILAYSQKDLGFGGLPKRSLQEAIRNRHVDTLIDLNAEFNFVAAYLCRCSHAKLRICLQHPHRDPFYNFQVGVRSDESAEGKYRTLVKYISVFLPASGAAPANLPTA